MRGTVTIAWSDAELYNGQLVPWEFDHTWPVAWTAGVERAGWGVFDVVLDSTPADPDSEPDIALQLQVIGPTAS